MWAFRPTRTGFQAKADENERHIIRGLARDVCILLGADVNELQAQAASQWEKEVWGEEGAEIGDDLSAYEEELSGLLEEHDIALPMDEAYVRLFPDMNEDPQTAETLREMTQAQIAHDKAVNVASIYEFVSEESEEVFVPASRADAFLAGINDIRLVLSARLGIHDDQDSEDVYDKASAMLAEGSPQEPQSPHSPRPIETQEELMAVCYSLLSWWQESLLMCMVYRVPRS